MILLHGIKEMFNSVRCSGIIWSLCCTVWNQRTCELDWADSGEDQMADVCEHVEETSGYI